MKQAAEKRPLQDAKWESRFTHPKIEPLHSLLKQINHTVEEISSVAIPFLRPQRNLFLLPKLQVYLQSVDR